MTRQRWWRRRLRVPDLWEQELSDQADRLDALERRLLLGAFEHAERLGLTPAEYFRRIDACELVAWERLAARYRRAGLQPPPRPKPLAPTYAPGGEGPM